MEMVSKVVSYTYECVNPNNNEKIVWDKLNRSIEWNTIIGGTPTVLAPLQLDSKVNVMQHAATIAGDEKIMKEVGLIHSDEKVQDFYSSIAKQTMEELLVFCTDQNEADPEERRSL